MENSNTPQQTQDPPVTEMPAEMVERVARALDERIVVGVRMTYGDLARVAIAAMRDARGGGAGGAVSEPSEAMLEAAARAMCAAEGDPWDALSEDGHDAIIQYPFTRADWRRLARVALIAGIAAALREGR